MRKITGTLFVSFVLALLIGASAHAQTSVERIQLFSVFIGIKPSGDITVQEKIVYDFGGTQKHGIFREIPFKFVNGKILYLSNISVTDENGDPYQFEVEREASTLIRIGSPDNLVTGIKTYYIKYDAAAPVEWGENSDRIIWNVTGNDWQVPIGAVMVQVSSDSKIAPGGVSYECYEGLRGSTKSCASGVIDSGALFFSTKSLQGSEGVTVAIDFPKGALVQPTPADIFWGLLPIYWPVLIPPAVFVLLFFLWWRKGRDPRGGGTVITQFEPPGGLSPIEVGVLPRGYLIPTHVSAQILDLSMRGYLKLIPTDTDSKKPKDYTLEKIKDVSANDAIYDQAIMTALFTKLPSLQKLQDFKDLLRGINPAKTISEDQLLEQMKSNLPQRQSVKLSELKYEFSKVMENINRAVIKSLIQKGYYDHDPRMVAGTYFGIALLMLFGGFFFLNQTPVLLWGVEATVPIVGIFGFFMPKVTKKGAIERENIFGFKNYLSVAEKDRLEFHNAPEKKPELFEKFLPYALALGVVDAWQAEFSDLYVVQSQKDDENSANIVTVFQVAKLLKEFSDSASKTSSTSGSGSSGGGSFSGGGAGGGGGGSW